LDESKSKHVNLAHQNGFGLAFLHSLLRLMKGKKNSRLLEEKNNKVDLIIIPCFWSIIMIGPSGLLLVVSHPLVIHVLI
jgi:hypothetical protein